MIFGEQRPFYGWALTRRISFHRGIVGAMPYALALAVWQDGATLYSICCRSHHSNPRHGRAKPSERRLARHYGSAGSLTSFF